MRYVAQAANYTHGIGEPTIALINGIEMETTKKRIARFQQGALLDREIEAGLKAFTFKGLADGVAPSTRMSVFDTRDYQKAHGLSDEQRIEIERILDTSQGRNVDFIKVDEIHAPKPFPSYDDIAVDKIISIIVLTDIDPDIAYRYEAENKQRPELLEAFTELGAADVGVPKELTKLEVSEGRYGVGGELVVKA